MFYIFTGKGKGKTTAALGLGLRAYGNGQTVGMVQFMKALPTGEREALRELDQRRFKFKNFGRSVFFKKGQHTPKDVKEARKALAYAEKLRQKVDILILDELNIVLFFKILSLKIVQDFITSCPKNLDLIITGRYAPKELIEIADLVTDMREVKHQYQGGQLAKKGLEY